jgi:hypothetical protein
MKINTLMAVLALTLLSACSSIKLVSAYDEVIDKGMMEFSEQLNTHIKNMAELGGKPEGSYDATFQIYNGLESKLEVLIARSAAASGGSGCKLESKVFQKITLIMKNTGPVGLQSDANASPASSASPASPASASACNERLLLLVKDQLTAIRTIHKLADKCNGISCIRPATAKDALAIANQSITAAAVVEAAKKQP